MPGAVWDREHLSREEGRSWSRSTPEVVPGQGRLVPDVFPLTGDLFPGIAVTHHNHHFQLYIPTHFPYKSLKIARANFWLTFVPVFILFPPQMLWSDSRGKTGNLLIEGFFWIPAFPKSIKPYNKSISIYPHQPGWDPMKTFVYFSHSIDVGKI